VVTAIAAQSFEPHAMPSIGEGTYLSVTDVTEPEFTVASHGDEDFVMPPTMQCSSDVHARVKFEPCSEATFDHDFAKFFVRTIRHPLDSFASPMHARPTHVSDVRVDHVTDGEVFGDHVAPPSLVT
jgi:hypothetical protein